MTPRNIRAALLFAAAASAAWSDTFVVPNAQTSTSGNAPVRIGGSAARIQEIVGSGQFPDGSITITALRFRSAPGTGAVTQSSPSVQVTVSTTHAYPNTLNGHSLPSGTYANNVGPDATVVYRGALSLSSPGCQMPGPCPFDMAINFTTPFSYDPTKGRFLIDLVTTTPTGTPTGHLDGVSFPDSTTSTIAVVGDDPNQPAGTLTLAGIVFQIQTGSTGQTPTITSVLNSADFSNRLCPGLLATVAGTNFGTGPASSVNVTVGGKSAAVVAVTPNQLNIQIPTDAAVGATTIAATVNNATSQPVNIALDSFAPALFSADSSGRGIGLVVTAASAKVTPTAPANPGDTLSAFAVGLGPTTPETPTGATARNPTATLPTLTIGGVSAQVVSSGGGGNPGLYQINFKVPPGLQGTLPMVLSIGGKSTISSVGLPVLGITALRSNAGFGSPGVASPGSIVSIFANGIGTTDQTAGFPSTTFQGYSVLFKGTPAPLFHLVGTAHQIDLLVPTELPTSGTVNIQLRTPTVTLANFPITMAAATPGLYVLTDPSMKTRLNVIAQFNATAWLVIPDSMAAALNIPGNCKAANINPLSICGQPASSGDFLVLYTSGLGKATPNGDPNGAPLTTGDIPPVDGSVLYKTIETPTVTLGGIPATVVFSGLAPGFPGL